jgi:hypothetical protein
MTASVGFLQVLVTVATVAASVAPVVLVALWIRDLRGGKIW